MECRKIQDEGGQVSKEGVSSTFFQKQFS